MNLVLSLLMQYQWQLEDTDSTRIIGYITLNTTTGLYEARRPHPGNHKGGMSIEIGTYPTLDLASAALQQ